MCRATARVLGCVEKSLIILSHLPYAKSVLRSWREAEGDKARKLSTGVGYGIATEQRGPCKLCYQRSLLVTTMKGSGGRELSLRFIEPSLV